MKTLIAVGTILQLVLCIPLNTYAALDASDVVVVILSQPNPHHLQLAENLRKEIRNQAHGLQTEAPFVYLSHIDFPHIGDWTILPLIPKLVKQHPSNISWFFIIEDRTFVHLGVLLEVLNKYDHNEPQWLSHAVYDREPTIIHHFAFHDNPEQFKYPNIASGVAISSALLERLWLRSKHNEDSKMDFSIDSAHELALFVWNEGSGQVLDHDPAFCVEKAQNCSSYPLAFQPCGEMVPRKTLYFAVKTCHKFHKDRLNVLKQSWAKHAVHVKYFSDKEVETIPTIFLGVPNTEYGHCKKTFEILKYVAREIKSSTEVEWIVLVDDDTILSVARIQKLLSCYNSSMPLVLGERYGFNVHQPQGYNYITGGGGTVLSRTLLEKLVASPCECPSISSPDDMYLGICVKMMGYTVTHSPLFHQARPNDYPPEYLKTKDAVSFHKHWMVNPVRVYEDWFKDDDEESSYVEHSEL